MNRQFGYGLMVLALASPFAMLTSAAASTGSGPSGQHSAPSKSAPGYLGIDIRDVNDDEVAVLKLRGPKGAEIIKVDHDGPAGKMGLRERDVVLQMNGATVDGEEQIRRMLHDCAPGKTVSLVISRDGQQLTVTTQMEDRAEVERRAWEQHLATPPGPQAPPTGFPTGDGGGSPVTASAPVPASRYSKSFLGSLLTSPSYTGAALEVMGPQLAQFLGVPRGSGLLVRKIEDNSPAAVAGMRKEDIVIRANAHTVSSMGDWAKVLREAKGKPVAVVRIRDKQEHTVILTPDAKKRSELELPFEPVTTVRLACLTEL